VIEVKINTGIMKTSNFKFWFSLLLLTVFMGSATKGYSQERKLTRQEQKELRKAQLLANYYALDTLLNMKNFVLEADFLQDKYGVRIPVPSNINFIKVDGTQGVLQTGNYTGMGYNGVGGATAEGQIGIWELSKNPKKLYYTVHFTLNSNIGNYDVFLTVTSSNNATATITGLGPGRLTWEGHLEMTYNSRVFKGQRSI
jgi:hypothetical protein